MTGNQIEKQEFLLNARSLLAEGQIVCPQCAGFGTEAATMADSYEGICRKCGGMRVVKRIVKVIVQDLPVGGER